MKNFILMCFMLAFISCGNNAGKIKWDDPAKFPWLNDGRWQRVTSRGMMYERWQKMDDSTHVGMAFRVADGDTAILEKLALRMRKNQIYYVADVSHNSAPVAFALSHAADSLAIFENPRHDFPQKIAYFQKSADSLLVRISGLAGEDSTEKGMEFKFSKRRN